MSPQLLVLAAIPGWVSSPRNVSNIILSPLFWRYTRAGLTGLIGIGLLLTGMRSVEDLNLDETMVPGGFKRLALIAVIMGGTMYGLARLGMVWTLMLAFAATVFLVRTAHP